MEQEQEDFHEILASILEIETGLTPKKARSLASHFTELEEFLNTDIPLLSNLRSISGKRVLRITEKELEMIGQLQNSGYLNPSTSLLDNYLSTIARDFVRRQLKAIATLNLDKLNPNPFLTEVLRLKTPKELVSLNVYMVVTRSIVTSMGFFIEKLLLTGPNVEKASKGWDVIKKKNGTEHWVQAKSGPQDMDKDQVVYWKEKIEEKIKEGHRAYIGITYGKRSTETISLRLLKQLLPNWEMKTLIGKELWGFIGDDPNYHVRLFQTLRQSALQILGGTTIIQEIEECIGEIMGEFTKRYGEGEEGVDRYLRELF